MRGCCHLAVDDHSGETIAITQGDCPWGFRVVHVRTVATGLVLGGAVDRLRRRGSGYRRSVVWSWGPVGRAAGAVCGRLVLWFWQQEQLEAAGEPGLVLVGCPPVVGGQQQVQVRVGQG